MSIGSRIEHAPRARPVADAPVEALLARGDDLARRWASELILARPLATIAEIPLEHLAREAPELCAQVLRALVSDEELQRLVVGEPPRGRHDGERATPARLLRVLAGARDPRAAVEQVEALRSVLWQELLSELGWPISDRSTARLVADLADRLAYVGAVLLATMLGQGAERTREAPRRAAPSAAREQVLYSPVRGAPGRRGAVLIDEHEGAAPASASVAARPGGAQPAAPSNERSRANAEITGERADRRATPAAPPTARPLPWDTPLGAERPEWRAPRAAAEQSRPSNASPDGGEPVVRITRRPSSPVD